MPDYNNGKIYRIYCITGECDDMYVGSTSQSLAKRWGDHKSMSKNEKGQSYRLYQTIAGAWDDWKIELVELYPCASKMELERREGELIRETGTLNEKIAGRTKKEHYQDNKEAIIEKTKTYRQQNKEAIAERQKAYNQRNAEAIAERQKAYNQNNRDALIENMKTYRQQNKEVIVEKKKAYRQRNTDAIAEYQRQYRAKKKAEAQAQTLAT